MKHITRKLILTLAASISIFCIGYTAADILPLSKTANIFQPSSRRWKQNIVPIVGAMDRVKRLQGVTYTWDKDHGGARDMGFIAEDVVPILPEIVKLDKSSRNAEALDYGHMNAVLVEALKEVNKQNEDLRQQFQQHQNEFRAFQQRMDGTVNQLQNRTNAHNGPPVIPGVHHDTN